MADFLESGWFSLALFFGDNGIWEKKSRKSL